MSQKDWKLNITIAYCLYCIRRIAIAGKCSYSLHAYALQLLLDYQNVSYFFETNETRWEQTGSVIKSFIIQLDELFRNSHKLAYSITWCSHVICFCYLHYIQLPAVDDFKLTKTVLLIHENLYIQWIVSKFN